MTIQRLSFNKDKGLEQNAMPSYEDVMRYVSKLGLCEQIVEKLEAKLRKMPPGAYGHFLLNINRHIDKAGENGKSFDAI